MRTKSVATGLWLVLLLGVEVSAFDFSTGRGSGMGRTLLLSHPSASELVRFPSANLPAENFVLEFNAHRFYGMEAMDELFCAGAYRHRRFTFAAGLGQFGKSSLYMEQTFKAAVAWWKNRWSIGGSLSGRMISFGGNYDKLNALTYGMHAAYISSQVMVGVVADNVNSPRFTPPSPAVRPIYSFFLEALSNPYFSVTARATFERTEKPQFALGQRVVLSSHGALFWGLSTAPLEYGGGVEVGLDRYRLIYAARYHPVLGVTHSLSLGYESVTFNPETKK